MVRSPVLGLAGLVLLPVFAGAAEPQLPTSDQTVPTARVQTPPPAPSLGRDGRAAQPALPTQPLVVEALSDMLQASMQRELEARVQIKFQAARIQALEADAKAAREVTDKPAPPK